MSPVPTPVLALESGGLWEVLALIVFLLAPLWRSVVEARKRAVASKRAPGRPRADRGSAPRAERPAPPDATAGGEDLWEALLRGELPLGRAEPEPFEDVEPEPEPAPRPAEPEPEPVVPLGDAFSSSFGELEPLVQGGVGAPAESGAFPEGRWRVAAQARVPRTSRIPPRGWRRAVVLREVLGSPVSLRGSAAGEGPLGW